MKDGDSIEIGFNAAQSRMWIRKKDKVIYETEIEKVTDTDVYQPVVWFRDSGTKINLVL